MINIINISTSVSFTYDHRTLKTRLPVRSALFKQRTGGLVVRWVTTSEYPLLYVFDFCFAELCGGQEAGGEGGWGAISSAAVSGLRFGCSY